MAHQNDANSSSSWRIGSPVIKPTKDSGPSPTFLPQPLRRTTSSAILARAITHSSADRRLSRFWRRQWRRKRPIPTHPAVGDAEKRAKGGNDLPRRGQPVECPLDDVLRKLEPKVKPNRFFPEFDDLATYRVDAMTIKELRRREAVRLAEVVKDPTKPVLLGESGLLTNVVGDDVGYQQLSNMAKSISTALSLCLLDNECITVKAFPPIANRERLQKLVRQANFAANMATKMAAPELQMSESHQDELLKATFALVDYISAILARMISQTASGPFWITNVTAVLAARVAKMKYLLMNLRDSANIAAENGDEVLQESHLGETGPKTAEEEEEECEEALRILEANTKDGLTSDEDAALGSYCVNQNKYRSGINSAMRYMLLSLRFMNRSGLPATTYEMSVVVYEIGFEGFKTVLFQDRDLEYSASSDRGVLNTAQPALCMLNQILGELEKRQAARPVKAGREGLGLRTSVEWAYQQPDDAPGSSSAGGIDYVELSKSKKLRLDHLADIVTVMVPMIATSPILLADFTSFRTMMALTGGVHDVVTPFQDYQFGAFCRLYTNRFDDEAEHREILRLSRAFREQHFSRCKLLTQERGQWGYKIRDGQADATQKLIQEKLDECCVQMQDWVVDESTVTVSNKTYVATVMMCAMLLGAGGLAIGFTVGERIAGVDPFNMATYAWVLAAFIVLICKSVRVDNWTWSDFLRWRVRCRSVSELASASGIQDQLVMAKLLHDDCGGSILLTRGPYNSVFRNQADGVGSGFSIDRPISAETLMLSGMAMLKVVAPRGHAIVCLDYRRGTYLTVVEHQGRQEKSRLICDDLSRIPTDGNNKRPRAGWYAAADESIKLKLTKTDGFKWKRVQGLYEFNGMDVVFE